MAALNWNDVVELTRAQVKQSKLLLLEDIGYTGTSWQPFSQAALLVEMTSEADVQNSRIAVFLKNAFMPDTATGETHTRTAKSFYNIDRNDAESAQHLVTLACSATAGPHTINVGDLVVSHEQSGRTLRLVAGNGVTFPTVLASGGTVTLLFEAEVAGADANFADALSAEDVTLALVTTLAGVTITSHVLEQEGVDEEDDPRLREREQLQWAMLTEGEDIDESIKGRCMSASDAIRFVVVDSTNPRGAGTFDVYIAGLDATSSDNDVALAQAKLRSRYFGQDSIVQVKKAPEAAVDLAGPVYFSGAYTAGDLQTVVEPALTAYLRGIPLGGLDFSPGPKNVIPVNDIESVIREAVETLTGKPSTVQLTTPSADLAIANFARPVRGSWNLAYTPISST
jgi:hypothetical protein